MMRSRGARGIFLGFMALALSTCGGTESGVTPPTPPPPPPDTRIGPAGGSTASPDQRATLTVPAGALAAPVQLTVTVLGSPPPGSVGPVYDIKPDGTQFNPPASLRLNLNASDIPAGVTPDRLRIATWRDGVWVPLPTQANGTGTTLTGEVRHLSIFGTVAVASPRELACRDLSLSTNAGVPTQTVELRGIADVLLEAELTADFRVPGGSELFPTDLGDVSGGRAPILILPHPTEGMRGGPVEIVISSGDTQCPGRPFLIEPLNDAARTMGRAVEAFEAIMVGEVSRWGLSTDGSVELGPDVPQPLQDLDHALGELLGRDGKPGLLDLVEGPNAPDMQSVNTLLERAGVTAALGEIGDALSQLPPSGLEGRARDPSSRSDWSPEWLTPEILEIFMQSQAIFEAYSSGQNKIFLDGIGVGLTAAGLFAGASVVGAPAGAAMGTAAAALSQMVLVFDIMAGLLPSQLEPLDLSGHPTFFDEDDPEPEGWWEAGLSASNRGVEIDWPTLASQLPGVGKAFKSLEKYAGRGIPFSESARGALESGLNMMNAGWGTQRTLQGERGVLLIEPEVFGPIRIDPARDKDFFEWRISGTAFELDEEDPEHYLGVEAGISVLAVLSRPGRFAGKSTSSSLDLEIGTIKVLLQGPDGGTSQTLANPGDRVLIRSRVEGALDPCLAWTAPDGGALSGTETCANPGAIEFTAPTEPGFYRVEAESTSRTGVRASGRPRRAGSITVLVGGLRLSPRPSCVEVGERFQFTARLWGSLVAFSDLVVQVQGGTLDAEGFFVATAPGTATVRVADPKDSDTNDEVTFQVVPECADWRMTLSGRVSGEFEGYCPSYVAWEFMTDPFAPVYRQPFQYYFNSADGNGGSLGVNLPIQPLSSDGSPEEVKNVAGAAVTVLSMGPFAATSRSGEPGLTLRQGWRLRPDGKSVALRGTLSGVLYENPSNAEDPGPVEVFITFRGMRTARFGDELSAGTFPEGWIEQRTVGEIPNVFVCLRTAPGDG
jgi:hypothetical protein